MNQPTPSNMGFLLWNPQRHRNQDYEIIEKRQLSCQLCVPSVAFRWVIGSQPPGVGGSKWTFSTGHSSKGSHGIFPFQTPPTARLIPRGGGGGVYSKRVFPHPQDTLHLFWKSIRIRRRKLFMYEETKFTKAEKPLPVNPHNPTLPSYSINLKIVIRSSSAIVNF